MSDIIWGAIIGVAGTLLGVIATGIITYLIQKKEREERLKELNIKLEHAERESRRDRLIKDRSKYLPELRKEVSSWRTILTQFINKIDSIGHARLEYNRGSFLAPYLEGSPIKKYGKELEEIKIEMDKKKKEIEDLLGLTCDVKIDNLINDILSKETEISTVSWPILYLMFDRNMSWKEFDDKMQEALDGIRKTSNELRKDLLRVSKRVEELSVGDESKDEGEVK